MIAQEPLSQVPSDPMDRLTPCLRHFERAAKDPKGMVLGQYHLLEELGRGGYGRVYKAQHALMNRLVALKLIAPNYVEDEKVRSWFRREVMACTRLSHPNIVTAYDADEIDRLLFLVMEYVDGVNLEHQIARQGPLSLTSAYQIMHQTALGLQFAHERGMVHRDIKPENLLLPRLTGVEANPIVVKIADFGLARLHPQNTPHNHTISTDMCGLGTPAFIAPEQAENIHAADIRSDLYSLGCTFYYALSGILPFPGTTGMEILAQHLKREPRPLEEHRPDIPPSLAGIIRRLMAKDPDKRFQSPAELASELSFLLGSGARWSGTFAPASGPVNDLEENLVRDAAPGEPLHKPPCVSPYQKVTEKPHVDKTADSAALISDRAVIDSWQVYWRQWLAVVERMARGENPRVHEDNYKAVHRELLRASRGQAALTTGPLQDHFARLTALVEPWLTPHSLAALDRKTLSGLFESCQILDRELGSKKASWPFNTWFVSLAGFLIALVVALWALAQRNTRFWEVFR